MQRYP